MGRDLKIISFNLKRDFGISLRQSHRWRERRELAARLIKESGAVVVGVQELLPHMRDDMSTFLQANYSVLGMGRFCGKKPKEDEHSDIIVKNDEADVQQVKTFWLSKHPERLSRAYYAAFPRICTVAEIHLREYDQTIRVFNTHLDHICGVARVLGVEVILQQMCELNAQNPMPTILMGDLNCKPNSRPVRLLRNHVLSYPGLNLTDVYAHLQPDQISNTLHNFSGKVKSGAQPIDYIFVSDEFEIVDTQIISDPMEGRYPSDHYPLLATLRFRPSPASA